MAIARPIRMLGAACILLTLFLVFQLNQSSDKPSSKLVHGMTRDPLLDRALPLPQFFKIQDSTTLRRKILIPSTATGEPAGELWRSEDHDYSPDSEKSARTNAALISLVRNEELYELINTMRDLERTWNSKFNYPYIFFNDKPFSEEFKQKTQAVTKAKIQYGTPARST